MRGKPGAKVSTETGRASVSSMAFHKVQPLPVATWSTSRYRPARRVPGSEVYVLIRQRREQGRLSASFQPLISHDHRPMVMNLLLSDVLPPMFSGEEKKGQGSVTVPHPLINLVLRVLAYPCTNRTARRRSA